MITGFTWFAGVCGWAAGGGGAGASGDVGLLPHPVLINPIPQIVRTQTSFKKIRMSSVLIESHVFRQAYGPAGLIGIVTSKLAMKEFSTCHQNGGQLSLPRFR